jgi:PAS domain-containing protein
MNLKDDEHLNILIRSAPIGIAILDVATLQVELFNEKFIEITGKPPESISGKQFWEPFSEVQPIFEDDLNRAVQGETVRREDLEIQLMRNGQREMIVLTLVVD